jgi:glycosyltransferase involved in cell wall biosynthesis
MTSPLFSIVINNYQYGRFLAQAIESCLAQDYPNVETIVVDDGSTDESRDVIAEFHGRLIPVLKSNGGQASAYHAGFSACSGEYVLFLDSDDALRSDAVRRFVEGFDEPGTVKVQSRMRLIDADSEPLGAEEPAGHLPGGDWKEKVLRFGPSAYPSTPSSASAYTRQFLTQVLPMPEAGYRVAADSYLKNVAPLFGTVVSIQQPLADYRLHGSNTSHWGWGDDPRGRLSRDSAHYELGCEQIARWANFLGHNCTAHQWINGRWQHLARKHVLFRLGSGEEYRVPWSVTAKAALDGSLGKRPFVLAAVALIYLSPVKLACALAIWLFRKKKIGDGFKPAPKCTSLAPEPSPLVPVTSTP